MGPMRYLFASAAALFALSLWHMTGFTAEVYVAPDGDDRNPGTVDRPLATLLGARDALRAAPAQGPKRIIVRGGAYYDVHLTLEPADSGLTIVASKGEKVVLYGGKLIAGWEKEGEKLWAAPLRGVREGTWDFRLLIVNDRLRPRARLPETGYFTHLNPFRGHVRAGVTAPPTEAELTTLKFKPTDIGPWFNIQNGELTVYHEWDESLLSAKAIDHATQTITFSAPAHYPPGAFDNHTYVIWNLREGLLRPGQWYLDRAAGKLVYWPLDEESIQTLRAVAPTTESIILLRGTKDEPVIGITLDGLAVECTTTPLKPSGWAAGYYAGAIHGDHTRDCRFLNLDISLVGGNGIYLHNSGNPLVDRCEVHATGAGGVYLEGKGGAVSNCRVHHVGEAFPAGIGIRVIGANHVVRHNEIHDTSYSGIEGGSVAAVIEYNRIYDFMLVHHDGGAIYNSYNSMANPCKDVVIRRNLVFYKNKAARERARAYYLDEQSWNCVVEENVALNTRAPCFLHVTTDCIVRNNVFIDEGDTELWWGGNTTGVRFERNVVFAQGTVRNRDRPATWKDNLFFSAIGQYENIPGDQTRADPLLNDQKNGQCDFKPASPAIPLGIKPVDVRSAGPE